jgi:hypothetical protein
MQPPARRGRWGKSAPTVSAPAVVQSLLELLDEDEVDDAEDAAGLSDVDVAGLSDPDDSDLPFDDASVDAESPFDDELFDFPPRESVL